MALTTLEELKTFMGITGTTNDSVLTAILASTEKFITNYIGYTIEQTTYENELYDGSESNELILNNFPVTSVSSLQYRGSSLNENDWETIDSDKYFLSEDEGIISLIGGFKKGKQNYRVTYVAGHEAGEIPADLQLVVWQVCRNFFQSRKRASDVKSESAKHYSVNYAQIAGGIGDKEMQILDLYKDLRV